MYTFMLICLKLTSKKDTQFFLSVILMKPLLVFQRIQVPFYCLWKNLSKHKNMCCLYSFRISNGKFHTPFRNSSNPLHSETQSLHYIFFFFLLHRGKRSVNLPSVLRLSGHKDCSLNYVNSSVQTRMMP